MKKIFKQKNAAWSTLAAISAITATALTFGHADMVYDEETPAARLEDRENTVKVLKTAQEVETSSSIAATAPVVSDGEAAPSGTKSELVRRARMREEMKNEDLLQERLEQLRLRDEERRTKKLLKSAGLDEEEAAQEPKAAMVAAPMSAAPVLREEVVAAPITETPGKPVAPAEQYQMTAAPTTAAPMYQSDSIGNYQSSTVMTSSNTTAVTKESDADYAKMSIVPRAGVSSFASDSFDVSSRFTLGIGMSFAVSDHVAIDAGYSYSEFNLGPATGVYNISGGMNQLMYKQNIADLGLKLYFTNADAKVRPFVGGGAGYSIGYVNYDQQALARMRAFGQTTEDYELSSFMGSLSGGMDVKVSRSVSIGAIYKYFKPLSTNESAPLYYSGFGQSSDISKQAAGASIRDSGIHSFLVGANFWF